MNGKRKCGTWTQWSIMQPFKRRIFFLLCWGSNLGPLKYWAGTLSLNHTPLVQKEEILIIGYMDKVSGFTVSIISKSQKDKY
jgi:hypothetical protein